MEDRSSAHGWRRTIITDRLLFADAPACHTRPTDGHGHVGPGDGTGSHTVSNRTPGDPGPYATAADRYCAAAYSNAYAQAHGHADAAAYTLSHPNPDTPSHRHAGADTGSDCDAARHPYTGSLAVAHRHTSADRDSGAVTHRHASADRDSGAVAHRHASADRDSDSDAVAHRHADRHPRTRSHSYAHTDSTPDACTTCYR